MPSAEYNETKQRLNNLLKEAIKPESIIKKMTPEEHRKYNDKIERMKIKHKQILDNLR